MMLGLRTRSAGAKVTAAQQSEIKKDDLPNTCRHRPHARKELKEVGWAKDEGVRTGKVAQARALGLGLSKRESAPRLRTLVALGPGSAEREGFKRELEKELTGRETEPHEIVYFRLYTSQDPVIE
jgi:hypothetical protein